MKSRYTVLGSTSALCISLVAQANDGGIAMVPVSAIETNARAGTQFTITGGDTKNLMKILPGAALAGSPEHGDHFKSLRIQSPGYSITFDCADQEFDVNTGNFKPIAASCSIRFEKGGAEEDIGDTWRFDPKEICQ